MTATARNLFGHGIVTRRSIHRLALIASTVAVVGLLAWFVDLSAAFELLRQVDSRLFCAACTVAVASRVLRAMKWNGLLRAGGVSIPYMEALRISTIGLFFGAWTPAQLGNDVYRTAALRKAGTPQNDAHSATSAVVIASLVVERCANWLSIAIIALCGLPWTIPWLWRLSPGLAMTFVVATLGIIVFAIAAGCMLGHVVPIARSRVTRDQSNVVKMFLIRTQKMAVMCVEALSRFRSAPRIVILFQLLTLVEILGHIAINALVIRSFSEYVSIGYLCLAMPAVYLLVRLPIAVQGIGVQEGAFGFVLANAGLPAELGLAVSLVQRVIEWLTSILPGAAAFCLTRTHWCSVSASTNVDL